MILIETFNRIVQQLLQRKLENPAIALDEKCGDFDNAAWHVSAADQSPLVQVSLKLGGGVAALRGFPLEAHLKRVVPQATLLPPAETEAPYDFSFRVDCAALTADGCTQVASLRRQVMSPPFIFAFDKFEAGEKFDPIMLEVREGETIEISSTKDNVVVRYTMCFNTDDDLMNAKILLQEFVDVKRHEKAVSAAPGVSWRPVEGKPAIQCEFVVFKTHTNAAVRDRTLDRLLTFRTYVHYHLMCSKAFIHSRMRARVEDSLKVLNRAKTHSTGQVVELIK